MTSKSFTQRGQTLLAWGLILLLTSLAFAPWFINGKVLAPFDLLEGFISPWNNQKFETIPPVHNHFVSDAVTQYIPYAIFTKSSYLADGYLGWNPLVFGGVAQDANTMAIPYDWSQKLYQWLDFWAAWHLSRYFQFLLAGFGMFVFLRGQGCAAGVALMAATAYLFNTQFIVWIYHQWALASFCWIPWLFWAFYKVRKGSQISVAPGALFLALCLCGGTLQHAAFVALAMLCLWLGWLAEGKGLGASFFSATLPIVATAVLALALAAPMLEVTIHAYLENLRAGQVRGGLGYAGGWSQPFLNLLTIPFYALPGVLGSPASLDLWKIFRSDIMNVASFGTLPVILAFLGLFSRRVPAPARLLMWVGLVIPLTPLVGPLYHRVQLLWILGGCWAAAAWVQQTPPIQLRQLASRLWSWFGCLSGAWFLASLVLFGLRNHLEPIAQAKMVPSLGVGQFGFFTAWVSQRIQNFFDYILIWNPVHLLVLAAFGLCLWGLPRIFQERSFFWVVAAAGVFLQASVFWRQWVSWSDKKEDVYQRPAWVRVLQREVGPNGRLAQEAGGFAQVPFGPNTLQPSGVPVAGGYESIHPHGLKKTGGQAWDFPGTTHYFGTAEKKSPEGWQRVHSEHGWSLWKNPQPSFGTIDFNEKAAKSLEEGAVERPSWNKMMVRVPAGAKSVDLFSNWSRGWEWASSPEGTWKPTQPSASGGIRLQFEVPLSEQKEVALQYDPAPPVWTFWVRGFSVVGMAVLVGLGIRAKPRPS